MTKLLAIVGPTCSGKSALGLRLASRFKGEIVSADSRQIYKYLDIGTSKPAEEDRRKIPHHFVDVLDPAEEYSAGAFGVDARRRIEEIVGRSHQPILVGGSGLYIKGVIDGFFEGPAKDPEVREQLGEVLKVSGGQALLEMLRKVDPVSASTMEPVKPRRIIRALEVFYVTGRPISEHHREQVRSLWMECVQMAIEWPRAELYRRIENRVDAMLARGLVEEVKRLQSRGYVRTLNSLNSVGYKEVFDFLEGKSAYDEMVRLIKQNTRRFAKRQLTWFRADKRIRWIKADAHAGMEDLASKAEKGFKTIYDRSQGG